jgi:Ca-activated chloride channel family protein
VIKWGQPIYLWLLLAVPVLAAGSLLLGELKRRRLGRAADPHLVAGLTETYSSGLARLKNLLLVGALALLLVAAARPKWGERLQLYRGRGIDVVIALDASKSMLAEDVKPNRLQRAKTELAALIDGLSGNNVGIVAFAGEAYVMCPLTTDAAAARMFLDIIEPNGMPVPGTDFGKAVDKALELLNPKEPTHKALVLVTDGEDLGRNTAGAIERAAATGLAVFPVAFATAEGAPIPEYDERGNLQSYKKDRDGQVVMSRMDERQLIVMAQATGGRFMRVEGFSGERMLAELSRIRQKEFGGGRYTDYVERYQWFLGAALLLMLAGLGLSNRRGRWIDPVVLRWPPFLRKREGNAPQSHQAH